MVEGLSSRRGNLCDFKGNDFMGHFIFLSFPV